MGPEIAGARMGFRPLLTNRRRSGGVCRSWRWFAVVVVAASAVVVGVGVESKVDTRAATVVAGFRGRICGGEVASDARMKWHASGSTFGRVRRQAWERRQVRGNVDKCMGM